jgi:hypothetical protein
MDRPPSLSKPPLSNGTTKAKPPSPVLSAHPTFTPSELAIAISFPATLILASIFHTFSPTEEASTSYFSHKTNLFNTVFVKYGWFWTTLAFIVHLARLRPALRNRALLRWSVATLWWVVVTQWFFGAPVMDRAFLWTGGSCEQLEDQGMEMSRTKFVVTSAACRVQGGKWRGGHDLSGHVFLLTHASLFLWAELEPVVRREGWRKMEDAVVAATVAVWWWMLLMTGVYFHTAIEKVCQE